MSKRILFRVIGYLLSVVPPALAVIERFPIFASEGSGPLLSGLALLLLLVAAIPLLRGLRRLADRFLRSPSAWGIWGGIWLFCATFGRIAMAVADIAMIGTLSSLIGAVFFRLAEREVQDEP